MIQITCLEVMLDRIHEGDFFCVREDNQPFRETDGSLTTWPKSGAGLYRVKKVDRKLDIYYCQRLNGRPDADANATIAFNLPWVHPVLWIRATK